MPASLAAENFGINRRSSVIKRPYLSQGSSASADDSTARCCSRLRSVAETTSADLIKIHCTDDATRFFRLQRLRQTVADRVDCGDGKCSFFEGFIWSAFSKDSAMI